MSDLVERLRRRAETLDALSERDIPAFELTRVSWKLESLSAMRRAAKDNSQAADRITSLEKENAELIRDCQRKDELLTAAVDDYNDARSLVIEECANVAYSIQPPKSIGRDHGRHHMAGAQAAARAIRARLASSERSAE